MENREREQFLLLGFQIFLKYATEMVFLKDTNLVYVTGSDSFARLVGLDKGSDLVGKTDFDVFPPELARKYTEDDRRVLTCGGDVESYIEPLPDMDGTNHYSATSKYVLRDAAGKIIGLYGVAYDVTTQMALEAERESSRLSRQMFDSVLEADLTEDRMLRVEGGDWTAAIRMSEETSFSAAVTEVAEQFIHPEHTQAFQEHFSREKLQREYNNDLQEYSLTTFIQIGERFRWMEFHSRVYHSRVSDTLRMTTFLRDIDEEVRSRQHLKKRADTDALTGLSNRESVTRRITACLEQEARGAQCAMLFVDLDNFKQINDRWGHKYGDTVLHQVAERLRTLFRGDDIFGRIGGDEFLVFLRQAPGRPSVESRARQAVRALIMQQEETGEEVSVTCSVGVAFGHYGEATVGSLYEQADKAMYQAKALGRNQVFFYEDLETIS